MKLHVETLLPVEPRTAWELFESEEFRKRLQSSGGMASEVLEERQEGALTIRRMRFTSKNELPTIAAKALGATHLTYEQENRMDVAKSRLDWVVRLPVLTDRVRVGGATWYEPHPGGCKRILDGNVDVNIAFVGGQIEKTFGAEFEKSMNKAIDIVRDLIREQGLAK